MGTFDTIFETPELEERFRKHLNKNPSVEIGGYLFGYIGLPSGILRDEWDRNIDSYPMTVVDWMLVPNVSRTPEREFRWAHLDFVKHITELNAQTRSLSLFNFHSHPKGSTAQPSQGDVDFALKHCGYLSNRRFDFVVVQSYPMRVVLYTIEYGRTPQSKKKLHMDCGVFWSWREKIIKYMASEYR